VFCNHNESQRQPCSIAFTNGPVGIVHDPQSLQEFLRDFTQDSYGWEVEMDNRNKVGYVANKIECDNNVLPRADALDRSEP
jgi:hypothetical protein